MESIQTKENKAPRTGCLGFREIFILEFRHNWVDIFCGGYRLHFNSINCRGWNQSKWQPGNIIAPIVIDIVIFGFFFFLEGARFALMKDRGSWSAGLISFLLEFVSGVESSYCINSCGE